MILPEDACNSTTNPVGLSSEEGPLCPQITQSYTASETCGSAVVISIGISLSGESEGKKLQLLIPEKKNLSSMKLWGKKNQAKIILNFNINKCI